MHGTDQGTYLSNPASQLPRSCVWTHPKRLWEVSSCTVQENTVYAVAPGQEDIWDSFGVNWRPNTAPPLCPLNFRVCTNLFTRGAVVYALFQHVERVFCQTSWGVLKLSPETGNRPQLPRLFMQSIFWHSCRTHRACCRLNEWFWEQQPPITMLLEIFLALSLLPYKSLNLADYSTAALFV